MDHADHSLTITMGFIHMGFIHIVVLMLISSRSDSATTVQL
jgi:hypothetical protein